MKRLFLVLLMIPLCAAAEPAGADRIVAAGDWKTVQLDLDVTVAPDEGRLSVDGHMVVEFAGKETRSLALLLNSRRPVMRLERLDVVDAHGIDPAGTKSDSDLLVHDADTTEVRVLEFPKDLATGQRVELEFRCESTTESMQVIVRPEFSYASWVEAWYPVPADPTNPDDPLAGSKARARGTTRFHLPAEWWSLSNGKRMERKATHSGVVEVWRDDYGTARSFAAAPFLKPQEVRVGDRTVAVYLLTPKKLDARAQAERLNQAIDVLSKCFGPYPYSTFAIAEMPESIDSFGAASEQGFIVARTNFFAPADGNLALFAHEAGHTWWGNLVSSTGKGHYLCSESIAQYGAALAIEAIDGQDAARDFLEFSRPGYVQSQCARGYFAYLRMGVDRPLSQLDGTAPFHFDHTLSDAKGHWVYHMLRHKVGDDVFFGTMRALVVRFAETSISLDDIRQAFIAAAPDAGLDRFFAQWLDRTGAPIVDLKWSIETQMKENSYVPRPVESIILGEEKGPFDVDVSLVQQQAGDPFVLDVEVGIEFIDGDTELRELHLIDADQKFRLTVDRIPRAIHLDPNRNTLLWRPAYGPRPGEELSHAGSPAP